MRKINNLQRDQAGFASIVIALILIIVLALITVGFAELARREQQNALDKQLSSQAYYAAESGVNDVDQAILQSIKSPSGTPTTPSLASLTPAPSGLLNPNQCLESQTGLDTDLSKLPSNTLGPAVNGVTYSCILLNLQPPQLAKTPLSADTTWTNIFGTTGGGALSALTINWGSLTNKPARTSGGFTPRNGSPTNWNSPAVLQVSITPLGNLNRTALINNTFTTYLYPQCSGSNIATYNSQSVSQQVPIVNGNGTKCSSGTYSATINNLSGTVGESYVINVLDYYDDSSVSISNATDGTGPLDFTNAQALIDVTGRAKNVLRRIQVHVPLNQPGPTPAYTVEGQNICKRFDTAPVIPGSNPGGTNFDGLDPSCNLDL
jgi:hypothetical protein